MAARHTCQPSLTRRVGEVETRVSVPVRDPAFAKLAWLGGEVETQESAKLLCKGSIPFRASRTRKAKCGTKQL